MDDDQANEDEYEMIVMAIPKNDPEFVEARKRAIETADVFIDLFQKHKDNVGVYFAVKAAIPDEGHTTYFWYTLTEIVDNQFVAYHYNIPDHLADHENIKLRIDEIHDWMVNDHGNLWGGWTVRVQRDRTPKEKRDDFDEHAGIKFYVEDDF